DFQFTQEARFASAPGATTRLADGVTMKWQTGIFFFTQSYDQNAINSFAPFVLSPQLNFPISQHSPESDLDDVGVGLYGQVTTTFSDSFDITLGARFDHENKQAVLNTFYDPAFTPGRSVSAEKGFSNVSPQFAASYHFQPNGMVYASAGRGFKAG